MPENPYEPPKVEPWRDAVALGLKLACLPLGLWAAHLASESAILLMATYGGMGAALFALHTGIVAFAGVVLSMLYAAKVILKNP